MKQIIFVVETNHQCESDKIYLNFLIKRFYASPMGCKIQWVLMDGNANYRSETVIRDTNDYLSMNRPGFNEIIYVLDEDVTAKQKRLVKEIKDYCVSKGYRTILFNTSIEHVLLGQRVSKRKQEKALEFIGTDKIADMRSRLECPEPGLGQSNVLMVLDKYLKRKKL